MKGLLSRRRFELTALGVAALFAILHAYAQHPERELGLQRGSGPLALIARAIHSLEGRVTDLQFRIRGPRAPHPDVVVVEIDEPSVRRHGRWPWRRELTAKAIRSLHEAGARSVGLDITFTDTVPDPVFDALASVSALVQASDLSPEQKQRLHQAIGSQVPHVPGDVVLAEALRDAPQVVHAAIAYPEALAEQFGDRQGEHRRLSKRFVLPHLAGASPGSVVEDVAPHQVERVVGAYLAQTPIPLLAESSNQVGALNVEPDADGSLRRLPLFFALRGAGGLLPAYDLWVAAGYFGGGLEAVYDRAQNAVVAARLGARSKSPREIPLDSPYLLIDYLGPNDVFPRLSLAEVMDGRVDPARLSGKAVLVGVTLAGNYDQRVTPFSKSSPGVFVHAHVLSNLLSGQLLRRPPELLLFELLFIFGAALALGVLLPRVSFRWKLAAIAGALGGFAALDQGLFARGLQLATVMPLTSVAVAAGALILVGYRSADRERARLLERFRYRVGQNLLEQMLEHPEKFTRAGERKQLTVLFSDIRGFTSLAERMAPEQLASFINEYLTPMTGIVFEQGGTLDKYIGDAIMAFWGAPVEQDDHADRACRTALRMLAALEVLRARWREHDQADLDIGIGINTGAMSVGFMGSDVRGDYTVMGDAVNLASRLEGTNKEYGTRALIAEGTWEKVSGRFVTRRLGAVRVKGKRRPVRIYELRGEGPAAAAEAAAISSFEAGLEAFADRRFDQAEAHLREVLTAWPEDPPTQRYLEEIAYLRAHPPGPAWDGELTPPPNRP